MAPRLGILATFDDRYKSYIDACREIGVDYELVDILASDWIERVQQCDCDGFLARPPCDFQVRKNLYDERLYCLAHLLHRPIYPSFDELFIYENKRAMADWLKINGYPHPVTHVFCRKGDALAFAASCDYPVVFKANIGASAYQVKIVKRRSTARNIIRKIFGTLHPELAEGYIGFSYAGIPLPVFGRTQRHVLLVQEYLKIRWEWRIIKIGQSYFGHQKLLKRGFASGSGRIGWVRPPDELLYMTRDLCERGKFSSMAVDIFELEEGGYRINELQSLFGSYRDSQMYIDGKPGRFVFRNDAFEFEEGIFNTHSSYLLRVQDFIRQLEERND